MEVRDRIQVTVDEKWGEGWKRSLMKWAAKNLKGKLEQRKIRGEGLRPKKRKRATDQGRKSFCGWERRKPLELIILAPSAVADLHQGSPSTVSFFKHLLLKSSSMYFVTRPGEDLLFCCLLSAAVSFHVHQKLLLHLWVKRSNLVAVRRL